MTEFIILAILLIGVYYIEAKYDKKSSFYKLLHKN